VKDVVRIPHYVYSTQPPMASGTAASHFQDRRPSVEMYSWRLSCIFTSTLRRSGNCLNLTSASTER